MDNITYAWCSVKGCMNTKTLEKRYFFRFPKQYDRWLQWVQACDRRDLITKGPEYAYHNCRICHLHFEEKWYKINKKRTRLQPDAIPTLFSKQLNLDTKADILMYEEDGENDTMQHENDHCSLSIENDDQNKNDENLRRKIYH